MGKVYAKIKNRGNSNKNRVFIDVSCAVYKRKDNAIQEKVAYDPATILGDGVWYEITGFSQKEYSIDIIKSEFEPVDFEMLTRDEYETLDYIFEEENGDFYFQNIGRAKLIKKKGFIRIGNDFKYSDDYAAVPISDYADAIYERSLDTLYFRNLSAITSIFPGISDLYREATIKETDDFLHQDFIVLEDGFSAEKVKTPNRKRIALAVETIGRYNKNDQKHIYSYICSYCPNLKKNANSFKIGSDEDLTLLLYGIEQRFYTTEVGNERRIANSVIKLEQ